ncbi:retrovirus polyprotein, putative [Perkinsus marinus ATCC 50983]|uniref:Retrovirus polyprotein, putative n=1 Tax=Perkinsus marinus (strain ATCC 50983 / TXsc) TaxID=423536 RepID=C5LCM6_PERM5|nr:retrovirus polyprotein, putative [Perkinsus marinus ATCC 50983]EER05709.1 retrovirus polyprotein, putative [Perkinsus marinus ATCC 50983]|eukprot:XP_002773893.1 retrovirus polyprotein, putative [Perkinsus marinus ATCC 50983]
MLSQPSGRMLSSPGDASAEMTVYVVDDLSADMLLGYDWLWRFGLGLQADATGFCIKHVKTSAPIRSPTHVPPGVALRLTLPSLYAYRIPSSTTTTEDPVEPPPMSATPVPTTEEPACDGRPRRRRKKTPWRCVRPRCEPVMYCRHTKSTVVADGNLGTPIGRTSSSVGSVSKAWSTTSQKGSVVSPRDDDSFVRGTRFAALAREGDESVYPAQSVDDDALSKVTILKDTEPDPTLYEGDFYKMKIMFAQSIPSPYPQFKPYLGSKAGDLTPYEEWPTPSMAPGDEMDDDVIGKDIEQYAIPQLPTDEEEVFSVPTFDVDAKPELVAVDEVCKRYKSLFSNKIGRCNLVEHDIDTYDAKPTREKPRRIPHVYRYEIIEQLDGLEKQGVIRRSKSPYAAPCVYVAKKDGGVRMCVDYRKLNTASPPSAYPVPLPDFVQESLAGSKVYTNLDLRSGYWQIPVRPSDVCKTAFCPGANLPLYEFLVMPFGLHSACGTFQDLMDRLLGDLPYVKVYLDDVLIFSPDLETHAKHLDEVFRRLAEANLTLNAAKFKFAGDGVKYLGHYFDQFGMHPDPARVQAIAEWTPPRTVSEVRSFLGLVNYYRTFIPRMSAVAKPIQRLVSLCDKCPDDVPKYWDVDADEAFVKLKTALIGLPGLAYPDFREPFQICCDASNQAIGGVLEQNGRPICYYSQVLSGAELRWHTFEKEAYALFRCLHRFHDYIIGHPLEVTIYSDHRPLQHLAKCTSDRVQRWILAMQRYRFVVRYKEGTKNINADVLSRPQLPRPDPVVPDPHACEVRSPVNDSPVLRSCLDDPGCRLHTSLVVLDTLFSIDDIRDGQDLDEVVSAVRERVLDGHPLGRSEFKTRDYLPYRRIWASLDVSDGILARHYRMDALDEARLLPVIPDELRERALRHYHQDTGHFAREKMLSKMKQQCYWPTMHVDVEVHLQTCTSCLAAGPLQGSPSPLLPVPVGRAWHTLGVDYLKIGPGVGGYKCLLVVQDYFTKWGEAYPLRTETVEESLPHLLGLFARFGPPARIHSDQGQQFESALFRATLDALGISKSRTTIYHPAGNGLVERLNGTILSMLRRHCCIPDWPTHLPAPDVQVQHCYPLFYWLQSLHAYVWTSLVFDTETYGQYVARVRAYLDDEVDQAVTHAAARYKAFYDRKAKPTAFFPNARVFVRVHVPNNKLAPRWEGDWYIVDIIGSQDPVKVLRLKHAVTGELKVINVDHVRLDPVQPDQLPDGLLQRVDREVPDLPPLPAFNPEAPPAHALHPQRTMPPRSMSDEDEFSNGVPDNQPVPARSVITDEAYAPFGSLYSCGSI